MRPATGPPHWYDGSMPIAAVETIMPKTLISSETRREMRSATHPKTAPPNGRAMNEIAKPNHTPYSCSADVAKKLSEIASETSA